MNQADELVFWISNDEVLYTKALKVAKMYPTDPRQAANHLWFIVLEPILYPEGQNAFINQFLPNFTFDVNDALTEFFKELDQ